MWISAPAISQERNAKWGKLGYSRDHRPGNPQITYGISVGENKIPTILTIQNGNVVDKEHMAVMLKLCSKVLEPGSLLIFDCGGNTKKNKRKILSLGFDYLTLKPKKKGTYKVFIQHYLEQKKEKKLVEVKFGDQIYHCAKWSKDGESHYIFFSKKTRQDQMGIKLSKLRRKLEKTKSCSKSQKRQRVQTPNLFTRLDCDARQPAKMPRRNSQSIRHWS